MTWTLASLTTIRSVNGYNVTEKYQFSQFTLPRWSVCRDRTELWMKPFFQNLKPRTVAATPTPHGPISVAPEWSNTSAPQAVFTRCSTESIDPPGSPATMMQRIVDLDVSYPCSFATSAKCRHSGGVATSTFASVFCSSSRRAMLDRPPEAIALPPLATAPSKALQSQCRDRMKLQ